MKLLGLLTPHLAGVVPEESAEDEAPDDEPDSAES